MATATSNVVSDNSSLANFKSWAQFISNFFTTAGWTQTTDTGQVNWGTIASVPSSTYVYEIWKAADSQASTTPIYVKVEYGFSSTQVGIRITTGTGSNGSGTLTGATMGPYVIANGTTANQGGTTYPCYASGDAGEIRFMMWQSNTTAEQIFGIERSKDSSGAKTTDYFSLLATGANSSGSFVQQTTLAALVTLREQNWVAVACSNASNTETFNSTTAANPVFPLVGKLGNPMLGFCMTTANDVAEGASVTVNIYAANHTYIATKLGSISNMSKFTTSGSSTAALMRYE